MSDPLFAKTRATLNCAIWGGSWSDRVWQGEELALLGKTQRGLRRAIRWERIWNSLGPKRTQKSLSCCWELCKLVCTGWWLKALGLCGFKCTYRVRAGGKHSNFPPALCNLLSVHPLLVGEVSLESYMSGLPGAGTTFWKFVNRDKIGAKWSLRSSNLPDGAFLTPFPTSL